MKVFISQPMKGLADEQILKVREEAITTVTRAFETYEDIEIIDSFFQSAPTDAKPLWYLGKSLELLSTANVCIFVKGWENARGCKIEHECCKQYGIPTLYFD